MTGSALEEYKWHLLRDNESYCGLSIWTAEVSAFHDRPSAVTIPKAVSDAAEMSDIAVICDFPLHRLT